MNAALRLFTEYGALSRVLTRRDMYSAAIATLSNAPEILQSGKLTALDAAMSRTMTVHFDNSQIVLPMADIDRILAKRKDSPTFGSIREIYARNCYLRRLRPNTPVRRVLDLGANRGMFSILALIALGADTVVGVEPTSDYEEPYRLLLEANRCDPARAPRYTRFVSSPTAERENPAQSVSIPTILKDQGIERFNLVKMDIEGHERAVFSEPEWLASVDTICMELHPATGDLSLIPEALGRYGFTYTFTDQHGRVASGADATFLYASCTGELAA